MQPLAVEQTIFIDQTEDYHSETSTLPSCRTQYNNCGLDSWFVAYRRAL